MTEVGAAYNKNTVAIVPDRMQSGNGRKNLNANKLCIKEFPGTLSGMTGNGYFIREAIDLIKEHHDIRKSECTPKIVSRMVYDVFKDLKNQRINDEIDSKYGLTIDDVVRGCKKSENGKSEVTPELMTGLLRSLSDGTKTSQFRHLLNNQLVTVGFNGKTPEIYSASPLGQVKITDPYFSAGSGSDLAGHSLAEFYETIPKPMELSTTKMIEALVRAKCLAEKYNEGVGGVSEIVYMKHGQKPTIIGEKECLLFEEIIRGKDNNLIGKRAANRGLDDIIKGATFEEIEPRVIGNDRKLDLHLRGYRV
jgi:20S proteasome alpha/beta subunit